MRAVVRQANVLRGAFALLLALGAMVAVGLGALGASAAAATTPVCGTITFTVNVTATTSPGVNDGSITVTDVTGGTPPYTYVLTGNGVNDLITSAATPVTFSGLAPGLYTVVVTDSNGCVSGSELVTVSAPPPTTLSITKTDNDGGSSITDTTGTAIPGEAITYTVTLKNSGSSSATGVTVNDLLPSGVSFVSDTPGQGTYSPTTGVWTAGTLAVGASVTLLLTGDVSAGATGTITNTATASASNAATVTATDSDTMSPCAAGLTAHVLSAANHGGTFTGLFCVNGKGIGTYTQGSVSGTGTVSVVKGVTIISAWGKGLALLGLTNGTKSGYVELVPAPIKIGAFTLT